MENLLFTCSTTNRMANSEMIKAHAVRAIAVIGVVPDIMRPYPLLPFSSLIMLSFPVIPNRLSSPNCCCSLAMRRLPAGDAFMQPPE